ncbi:MAG: hypothetical protein Q4D32_01730 [Eubacteriales bacterium]|nr:hypothetical protein [Eubacteriales bacterium]
MSEPCLTNLTIDPDFERIMIPCSQDEYKRLEQKIIYGGRRPIIITWNNNILKGLAEYKICKRCRIPFTVKNKSANSRAEIMIWLCLESIKQRKGEPISNEHLRYCIGKLYLAQKEIQASDPLAYKHLLQNKEHIVSTKEAYKSRIIVSLLLKDYISCSPGSVYRYSVYAAAVDALEQKTPGIASKILQGNCKLSQNRTIRLAFSDSEETKESWQTNCDTPHTTGCKNAPMSAVVSEIKENNEPEKSVPGIKNMPKYDPDAELSSLSLTIPMWINSLKRTQDTAKFGHASSFALDKLSRQLEQLTRQIKELQRQMQEEGHERNRN